MISTFWDRLVKTFTCDSLHLSQTLNTIWRDCANNRKRSKKAMNRAVSDGFTEFARVSFARENSTLLKTCCQIHMRFTHVETLSEQL